MTLWWELLPLIVLIVFLLLSVGYGSLYRGWGPPFPSYIQKRRGFDTIHFRRSSNFDYVAWGWKGDIVWIAAVTGIVWTVVVFFSEPNGVSAPSNVYWAR